MQILVTGCLCLAVIGRHVLYLVTHYEDVLRITWRSRCCCQVYSRTTFHCFFTVALKVSLNPNEEQVDVVKSLLV